MLGRHCDVATGLETHWFSDFRRHCFWSDHQDSNAEDWLEHVMEEMCRKEGGKPRWAEKTPGNVLPENLEKIWNRWPDAYVVAVHRDPMDVYASLMQAGKAPPMWGFIASWKQYAQAAQFPDVIEVSYRSLVVEPERVMPWLLGRLDLEFDTVACSPWAGTSGEELKLVQTRTGKDSTTLRSIQNPAHLGRIGIGKNVLPLGTQRVLETLCH